MKNSERPVVTDELKMTVRAVEALSASDFPQKVWLTLCSIVNTSRNLSRVQSTVREYPSFTPRAYVILTLLYGRFASRPKLSSILTDLEKLFGTDLDQKEKEVVEYCERASYNGAFFPELITLWARLEEVYAGMEEDMRMTFPPTPHHAYALVTLNRLNALRHSTRELMAQLPEVLKELHNGMATTVAMIESSREASH